MLGFFKNLQFIHRDGVVFAGTLAFFLRDAPFPTTRRLAPNTKVLKNGNYGVNVGTLKMGHVSLNLCHPAFLPAFALRLLGPCHIFCHDSPLFQSRAAFLSFISFLCGVLHWCQRYFSIAKSAKYILGAKVPRTGCKHLIKEKI